MNGETRKNGLTKAAQDELNASQPKPGIECVLVLREDGSVDIHHPDGPDAMSDVSATPDHLESKNVKQVIPMAFVRSNSGCIYVGGHWYCW